MLDKIGFLYYDSIWLKKARFKNAPEKKGGKMMRKSHFKMVLSLALALAMIFTMVPAVHAENDPPVQEITLVWSGEPGYVYDGQPHVPTASFDGMPVDVTGEQVNAGSGYIATASVEGYIVLNPTRTFDIYSLRIAAVWDTEEYVYNGSQQGPTATAVGESGQTITLNVTGLESDAGTHTAQAVMDDASGNYTLINDTTSYTIQPQTVAVEWDNEGTYVYSGQEQGPSASASDEQGSPVALDVTGLGVDAGSYTASASTADTNYALTDATASFEITAQEVAVVWDGQDTYDYTGSEQGPSASATDQGGSNLPLTVTGKASLPGDYQAQAQLAEPSNNYTLTNDTFDFSIGPETVAVVWNDKGPYVYGDSEDTFPLPSAYGRDGSPLPVSVSYDGADAGEHTATASLADTSEYTLSNDTYSFTVAPMAVSVLWEADSYTYNGESQGPRAYFLGVNGEEIDLDVDYDSADAGTRTATASMPAGQTNYVISGPTTMTFHILPVDVDVTWGETTLEYNGQAQHPEVTAAAPDGLEFAVSVDRDSVNVGEYTATATLQGNTAANYQLHNDTTSFSILVKPVTVVWNNSEPFVYDMMAHLPEATVNGLVEGDAVLAQFSGEQVKAGENYEAAVTLTGDAAANYVIVEGETALFTIEPKSVNVTWSNSEAFVYDQKAHLPEATVDGLLEGDAVQVEFSGEQTKAGENYTATATLTGASAENYVIMDGAEALFTIAPKPVTLTWDESKYAYDGTAKMPAYSTEDLLDGDDVTIACKLYSASGSEPDAAIAAGDYVVEASLTGADAENYVIESGKEHGFNIGGLLLTLTWEPASMLYNGQPQQPEAEAAPVAEGDTLKLEYTITKDGQAVEEAVAAGTYEITAAVPEEMRVNYTIENNASFTFTIVPLGLTAAWDETSFIYNGEDQQPRLALEGFAEGDEEKVEAVYVLEGSEDGEKAVKAGDYSITATLKGDAAENYILGENGELTTAFEIAKRPVVIIPAEGQTKIFDSPEPADGYLFQVFDGEDLPETLSEEALRAELTGAISRDGFDQPTQTNNVIADSQAAGDHPFNQGTLASENLEITFVDDEVYFVITPRPITVKPEARTKSYGAADFEDGETSFPYILDVGDALTDASIYKTQWITGQVGREEGEAVGEYPFTLGDVRLNDKARDSFEIKLTEDVAHLTILPVFAGTLKVNTQNLSTRTKQVEVEVEGITADLTQAPATLILSGMSEGVAADISVTGNGVYTFDVNPSPEGDEATYLTYLRSGESAVQLLAASLNGGAVATDASAELNVAMDQLQASMGVETAGFELFGPDGRVTYGVSSYGVCQHAYSEGDYQEAARIEITVGGAPVDPVVVEVSEANDKLEELLRPALKAAEGPDGAPVPVTVTVTVCSGDLIPTVSTVDFVYDYMALPVTDDCIIGLNNRSNSFTINLPEEGRIEMLELGGFNPPSYAGDAYATSVTVTTSPAEPNLPTAGSVTLTLSYIDKAGNRASYTKVGVPAFTGGSIDFIGIEPVTSEDKEGNQLLKGTPAFRLSGLGIGYENISINISGDGFSLTRGLQIPSSGAWSPEADDYWTTFIGVPNSSENIDLPVNVPLTLTITYSDIGGGGYRTRLLYDDEAQSAVLLSPLYPGMRFLGGYTEVGSTVKVTWSNGEQTVKPNLYGVFTVVFEEGIFDSEITLTVEDNAGNISTMTLAIPERVRDVENMNGKASPVGTVIHNDLGMGQFVATKITLKDLQNGPIELPLLLANYFQVGTITVSLGEDGKVSFEPLVYFENQVEGAQEYFRAFRTVPGSDALDEGKRGEGMNISEGYTPAKGDTSFWFVYEVDASYTDEQLTDPDSTETVDVNSQDYSKFILNF